MSRSSHRPNEPAYYFEDCRIFTVLVYIYCDAHSCISAFFSLILGSDVYKAFYGHRFKKIKKEWKVCFEECIYPEAISFIIANAEMGKNIHLHMKNVFDICYVKNFVIWRSLAKLSLKNEVLFRLRMARVRYFNSCKLQNHLFIKFLPTRSRTKTPSKFH